MIPASDKQKLSHDDLFFFLMPSYFFLQRLCLIRIVALALIYNH